MNADSADFPHNEHLDDVLQIISRLARKAAVADYIYRGEPERYEQISSSFYRDLPVKLPAGFNVDNIQASALKDARRFTFESEDLAILTELQHYGGKTNLIDFTADYHIALFFACDGRHTQDGRVIFLERDGNMKSYIHVPRNPVNRVTAQKSVFVRPPLGYIEVAPDDIVTISSSLKIPILEHLRKAHGISVETVYNDLHGFIRYAETHQDAFRHLLTARTNLLNSDYRSAIVFFTKSLNLNPSSLAYSNRGSAYTSVHKYDDAIADYDRAIALNPNDAAAYDSRGVAKTHKGDYDGAIADSSRAIALDPNDAAAYYNRGIVKAHKGDYDGTIADCSRAIALDPNNAAPYDNRGFAKLNKGDYDGAIDDCSCAIAIDPNYAAAYNNRGTAKARKGDYDSAIDDYDRAIAIDPNNAPLHDNRGVAKLSIGDYDGAIDDCSRSIELEPDEALAYRNRGMIWLRLSEWDNAREDLATARNRGVDIVALFRNGNASVADFEQRNGIALPPDIVEMLGG